jgi:RNA polymerase sigma factor (sigma-70 family)
MSRAKDILFDMDARARRKRDNKNTNKNKFKYDVKCKQVDSSRCIKQLKTKQDYAIELIDMFNTQRYINDLLYKFVGCYYKNNKIKCKNNNNRGLLGAFRCIEYEDFIQDVNLRLLKYESFDSCYSKKDIKTIVRHVAKITYSDYVRKANRDKHKINFIKDISKLTDNIQDTKFSFDNVEYSLIIKQILNLVDTNFFTDAESRYIKLLIIDTDFYKIYNNTAIELCIPKTTVYRMHKSIIKKLKYLNPF